MSYECKFNSNSLEETLLIAKNVGRLIEQGTVIALYGDLGSGKTSFVQGLGQGFCVPKDCYITSPTYTIINEYPGRVYIYHVDLYRIKKNDLEDIGFYEIFNSKSVVAIEWAEKLGRDFFSDYLAVSLKTVSESLRAISIKGYGKRAGSLIEMLKKTLT